MKEGINSIYLVIYEYLCMVILQEPQIQEVKNWRNFSPHSDNGFIFLYFCEMW